MARLTSEELQTLMKNEGVSREYGLGQNGIAFIQVHMSIF